MEEKLGEPYPVAEMVDDESMDKFIASKADLFTLKGQEDPFYVVDLGNLVYKYNLWRAELPRVMPFYAVKCNDDPEVLSVLAQLGTGFDCASKNEIAAVMQHKVTSSHIIYANPCKQNSHIRYAAQHNVSLMTFDSVAELHKVKTHYPDARLVLRILPPDESKSLIKLGVKYGAHPRSVPKLLTAAASLGLSVVGVSFHVGSPCSDPAAFEAAIAEAGRVFEQGQQAGFNFWLLDIGGGFPGSDTDLFKTISSRVRASLDNHFPVKTGVKIIGEPGRYFATGAFSMVANIFNQNLYMMDDPTENNEAEGYTMNVKRVEYTINEGIRGSLVDCHFFREESHVFIPIPLNSKKYEGQPTFSSSVWGPTCEDKDCVHKDIQLPLMQCGDWLLFRNMGAYTMVLSTTYSGMPKTQCFYVMDELAWKQIHAGKDSSNDFVCG